MPLFPQTAHDWRWLLLGLALVGLLYGSLVAFRQPDARGVVAYSSLAQMNLIIIGIFAFNANGTTGAIFQMVNHGVVSLAAFLLIGLVETRTGTDLSPTPRVLTTARRPTVFLIAALWALAVPGSSVSVSVLHPDAPTSRRRSSGAGRARDVLAAMYMLRWYSAPRTGMTASGAGGDARPGPRVRDRGSVDPDPACAHAHPSASWS